MKKKRVLCKYTRFLLSLLLPLLTLSLITLLISYLIDRESTPLQASILYPAMLEYIFASLAILVGGCLLTEALNAEHESKK